MKPTFLPSISPQLKTFANTLILFMLLNSFMLIVLQKAFARNQHLIKEWPAKQQHKKEKPVKHHHQKRGQPIKFYPPKIGIA